MVFKKMGDRITAFRGMDHTFFFTISIAQIVFKRQAGNTGGRKCPFCDTPLYSQ